MNPSTSEHSSGRESVTVAGRPFNRPCATGFAPFHPVQVSELSRSLEPSQRSVSVGGDTAPRLQPTTARIRRSVGSDTDTVRRHGPGSVHEAVTVKGERASERLNGCVTPRAYS